ncbi:hypothetical protein EVAR_14160_1 [Eumeta japonica]|uniref:Histone-lysine N-methyltransferase SETMAR n=1 Tax=Eumeta variegata TaxID=151549 RepID=A0A4C1UFD3_EUMVA|nr:hypothetical protein EVAR_14160_1 [Eumeta japonica]
MASPLQFETKLQSMTRERPSSPTPKKFKASRSGGKIMGSRSWDNERSAIAMAVARDAGFEILEHLPSSSDLALSDFYLFPKLKDLKEHRFEDDETVVAALQEFFRVQDEECLEEQTLSLRTLMLPLHWLRRSPTASSIFAHRGGAKEQKIVG